jgi:hypothetical protein
MSVGYSGLKNEILTDPLSFGYAQYVSGVQQGNDLAIANLVNSKQSGSLIFRNDIAPKEVIEKILPNDFAGMAQIQLSRLNVLFQSAPIDATISGIRQSFVAVFSGGSYSGTVNALNLMARKEGTRSEVLFGAGTVVTQSDVSFALRGTL